MIRARIVALTLLVAALAVGCGIPADEEPRAVSDQTVPEELARPTDPVEEGRSMRATLFFTRYVDERSGVLVRTERDVATGGAGSAPPTLVLEALLEGVVDGGEQDEGIVTRIPANTVLANPPELDGGILTIDLSAAIRGVMGDGAKLAYGQMVCTATELAEVEAVLFTVEGDPVWPPTGDGETSDGPLACTSYANLLEQPLEG
ncbi:MAG: GerMN domain-containing protein [Acidimicrobiales bacterium]|nr:GerMN domain-containing protein [Acidimicrobiales bacterium]